MKKWKNSSSSNKCNVCGKRLLGGVLLSDKVHCRCCGEIVCKECSGRKVRYLPILEGTPVINRYPCMMAMPVCDVCYKTPNVLFIDEGCPENASADLRKLYNFVKKIIIEANQKFPVSGSRQKYFKDYDPNLHASKSEKRSHLEASWHILKDYKTEIAGEASGVNVTGIEEVISHCLKVSIANCYEMSLYCYLSILYATQATNFHVVSYGLYSLPFGDHVFLMIAPIGEIVPPGISNSDNFERPRCNIIVCDPWRKMLFFLRSMSNYMGMTIIQNIPHYTMNYGQHFYTKYLSMGELEDSIFKKTHRTDFEF